MVDRRFAFDLDVLQRLMATVDGGAVPIDGEEETLAAVRLLVYADAAALLPEVEAELVEFANLASGRIPFRSNASRPTISFADARKRRPTRTCSSIRTRVTVIWSAKPSARSWTRSSRSKRIS